MLGLSYYKRGIIFSGKFLWYRRCRIVPEGTKNCSGAGGINCQNTNYITVSF
jgi:hypothetical protein